MSKDTSLNNAGRGYVKESERKNMIHEWTINEPLAIEILIWRL
jgi:hypothetical protein